MNFEYTDDSSTWIFQQLPDIPKGVHQELEKIGGLNCFGRPNLVAVKGNEVYSDRTENKTLKYFCGMSPFEVEGYRYQEDGEWKFTKNVDNLPEHIFIVPDTRQEELGLLRYVVEKWTSPEELAAQHRFQTRYMDGELLLREFPKEGIYQLYQIIESSEGFREIDRDVLEFIHMRWQYDLKNPAQWEVDRENYEDRKQQEKKKILADIWNPENFDIKLSPEERERREEFWAKKRDWAADQARYKDTAVFYPAI